MENLITADYAWGHLKIGGTNTKSSTIQGSASDNKRTEVDKYISVYQKEFLTRCFGGKIAKLPELPEAILSLLVDSDTLRSPLMNYVFVRYQQQNSTFATVSGEKKLAGGTNAQEADLRIKMANAWNDMVDEIQRIHNDLYVSYDNYVADILDYLAVGCAEYTINHDQKTGIVLHGGIFDKKSMYDFNK